jgi:hypothetical protein
LDGITGMTESHAKKLEDLNLRLCLVMGYAMSMLFSCENNMPIEQLPKYKWLKIAIENLIYLDKPLPPMP